MKSVEIRKFYKIFSKEKSSDYKVCPMVVKDDPS